MIDLHCHILPGVDDGARSLDESLALARNYVEDGVTHVAATPHCHRSLRLMRRDILPHVRRLNDRLREASLPLTVLPGAEIQLTDVEEYRRDYEAGAFCHLGGGRAFTLLEFPWQVELFPKGAAGHVRWLRERGTIPIVAHPERQGFFVDEPERLEELVEAGAWVQITVDSLQGRYGAWALEAGERFLRAFPDAVLATDTHHLGRCSRLSAGYEWARRHLGVAHAAALRDRAELILERLIAEG